jgi:hypothetical protein
LKVTELFSKVVLPPMFVYGDCMAVCSIFIHLSATGVAEKAESTHLKGCPYTFVIIVYNPGQTFSDLDINIWIQLSNSIRTQNIRFE